jgi:S1-C subfamily serine protease
LEQTPILGDLQLFGTEVTAAGAELLKTKIETANVFVGRGGFLGITCEPSSLVIQEALSDGPAAKAGILRNDKLKKIDGVAIFNFEDLRKQLAKSAAGEKVLVEYDRPIMSMKRRDPNQPYGLPPNGLPPNALPGRQFGLQFEGYETNEVEVVLGKRPSDVNR